MSIKLILIFISYFLFLFHHACIRTKKKERASGEKERCGNEAINQRQTDVFIATLSYLFLVDDPQFYKFSCGALYYLYYKLI